MRLLGKDFAEDMDVYSALKTISGLDTDNSNARVEKLLTKLGLYRYQLESSGKKTKQYLLISELKKEQKRLLVEHLDLPRAVLKSVRMSPRKARLVADLVRGKKVDEAIRILRFTPNKPADIILKVLKSAVANAETNHGLKVDSRDYALYIKKLLIEEGATWKRFRARARGRAGKILKRTSHVKLVLGEVKNVQNVSKKKAGKAETKTSAKAAEKEN